ncbi:hypothetical protein BH20ACT2_BH20ACT2_13000 [soil metagenome]
MLLHYALCLPREAVTVPMARHLTRDSLRELGVKHTCIEDIELALGEACANVLRHAGGDDEYEIAVDIDGERCTVRVHDRGRGFDPDAVHPALADAERGRGLELMRLLVDELRIESRIDEGTVVVLAKELTFEAGAVMHDLAR